MHYSQLKKQGSSRKNTHPGTPRPNPPSDNFQPVLGENSYQYYASRDPATAAASTIQQPLSQERVVFNFKRQGKSISNKNQQRNCGLPVQEKAHQVSPTNSNENLPDYLVWVKNEPFDFGILSPLPCPKIGINILRKVAEYCRKKPDHYPQLSLNQWSHICKYKMQLAVDLSFTYFRAFDVLTRPIETWTRHQSQQQPTQQKKNDSTGGDNILSESWDLKFHRVLKQGHDFNEDFKVDTMNFLLFLYIQHFLRLHKKYFMNSCGDEPWPKTWVNNLVQKSSGAGTGANVPEQQQAEFIMANLPDIIDFLMIMHESSKQSKLSVRLSESQADKKMDSTVNCSNSTGQLPHCQRIHVDVIKALSLILGVAGTAPNTEFKSFDECLLVSDIRWKLEYSKYSRTVDKKCFIQWVVKNLKINPWGPSSVSIPQVSVSLMTGVCDEQDVFRHNKIFWNTQVFPKT